jgi:hypothetical protein
MISQPNRRRWPWMIVLAISNLFLLLGGAVVLTALLTLVMRSTQQALTPLAVLVLVELAGGVLLLFTKRHAWVGQALLLSLLLGAISPFRNRVGVAVVCAEGQVAFAEVAVRPVR